MNIFRWLHIYDSLHGVTFVQQYQTCTMILHLSLSPFSSPSLFCPHSSTYMLVRFVYLSHIFLLLSLQCFIVKKKKREEFEVCTYL